VTFTRTELWFLAFLWLANQWHLEQVRQATAFLDKAFAEIGRKLSDLMLRPSPLMRGLG
jgi:hypothetical protein